MKFSFSEEQNMLKDSVARFVQDEYSFEARCKIVESEAGFSADNWSTFAELGWLSIPFPEKFGGFDGSAVDIMAIMEEMGKGLIVEPFVATVLLFGVALNKAGNTAQQETNIPDIIAGKLQGAVAFSERQSRYELADVETTASADNGNFTINGEKTLVLNALSADKLIVSARTSGKQCDQQGISLFLVDAKASGISKTTYRMMDGQRVANISFDNITISEDQLLGNLGDGYQVLEAITNDAILAICAEAVGIMQTLNATTIEYAKTREQFGVAIGSFQALQHRMVDMFMACEQTKSLLYRAVCSIDDNNADPVDVQKNILALKVMVGRAGQLIGAEAIQLHGGMGITDELNVGHYAKRLMMINASFGDADYQQAKFSALTND